MGRWLLALALLACASIAHAADDETRARDLFTEGRDAMNRGDYAIACAKFEESMRLFRRASMLLNLGACNEKLGKLATSLRYWQEGVSALEITDPRYETSKEEVRRLLD